MLKSTSEITSLTDRLKNAPDGTDHGNAGAGQRLTVNESGPRDWLLAQPNTAAADKALLTSLQSSLGVGVSLQTEARFPEGRAPYQLVTSAEIDITDPTSLPAAIARMEAAMTPPEPSQAEDWLVLLQAACAGGKRSEAGGLVALELYAQTLRQFPADVAREACKTLALRTTGGANWFPTLSEVNAECERLASPRRTVVARLRAWKPKDPEEVRAEAIRGWMLDAANARDEAAMCKRSDPDRHSELMEFVAVAEGLAAQLRRREISPDDLPPPNTPDKVEL